MLDLILKQIKRYEHPKYSQLEKPSNNHFTTFPTTQTFNIDLLLETLFCTFLSFY